MSRDETDEILSPRKKFSHRSKYSTNIEKNESSLASKRVESPYLGKVNEEREDNHTQMSDSGSSKETLGHSTPSIVLTVTPGQGENSIRAPRASKNLNDNYTNDDLREKNSILKDEERLYTSSKVQY